MSAEHRYVLAKYEHFCPSVAVYFAEFADE